MAQSLAKVLLHVVFSTKNRINSIPQEMLCDLHAYLAGACRSLDCEAFKVGGTSNHVHIACCLPRTLTISKLIEEIKKSSSKWMKAPGRDRNNFAWQTGYGVFSLGQSQLPILLKYIENQHIHHQKQDFKAELRDLLTKYQVTFDEKYVWE